MNKVLNYLYRNLFCKHEEILIVKYSDEYRLEVSRQRWRCSSCGKEWPLSYAQKLKSRKELDIKHLQ